MTIRLDQASFTAALLEPGVCPAGLTTARGVPDALRFNVYRNNVAVALITALEKRFPVTRRLVGDDFFRMLARAFIAMARPASPVIAEYGDGLADFIAGFEPAAAVPYLPDVARIEAAWTRAYHALDSAPAVIGDIAALPPEALPALVLRAHPSATLVHSAHPAGSIWAAHQTDKLTPVTQRDGETILVTRPELEVRVSVLPAQDAGFAASLFAGATLATAAATVTDPLFDFGTALVGLVSLGAFEAIDNTGGEYQ